MNQSTANRTVETLGSVASWLVPLVIYVSTIAPLVTAGDAGEFIVAAHRFSLPHPPGYPLYMLLLKLWTYLPISLGADPYAVRANLFSAVCMAIACGFFYKLMRILSGSAPASLAAALILAVSRTLWKFAVVTEVYGLNMLLTVLVLYGLALASVEKKRSGLVLVSLAFGFGLAHHETIVLLAPMIFSLWPKGRGAAHIHGGTVFFCIVAPLLLYALIPIMAANSPEYSQTGFKFRDFIQTVTRAEYRERASHQNPAEEQLIQSRDIIKRSVDYLGKQFGWFLLALGVLGWLFAPSGRRAWAFWAVITTCIWLVAMAFFSRGSPLGMPFNFLRSIDEFMIPVNMFIAMGFAWLLAPIAVMLTSKADISGTESQNIIAPRYIPLTIALLLCVIPLFLGFVNSHYSSFAHHTFEQDQARNQLEQVPENGVLVLSGDQSFLFEYLQEVRGIRKDVTFVVYPFSLLVVGEALPPANSLAFFIDQQLGDRTCMFSFSPPAAILPYLKPPRALELDGVTFKLIKAEPGQPEFRIGNPAVWANYQLRNLDPGFLATYIPDAYEYETFAMYISCSRAAVNWLVDNGYQNDDFTLELSQIADSIEKALKRTDYPSGPALKIETFPEQPAIQESVVQESVPEEEHIP